MPRREHHYFVYIAASRSLQLYVGVTNSVERHMKEHREQVPGTYTARYRIDRRVYFEHHQYILNAIARETELKDWSRARKLELIASVSPAWEDLSKRFGTQALVTERTADSSASLRNDNKEATATASTTAAADSSASLRNDNKEATATASTTAAADSFASLRNDNKEATASTVSHIPLNKSRNITEPK